MVENCSSHVFTSSSQAADHRGAHLQVPVHVAWPGAGPAAVCAASAPGRAAERREGAVRAALFEGGGSVSGPLPGESPGPQDGAGPAVGPGVGPGPARGQLTADCGPQPGPAELHHPRRADQHGPGSLEALLWISV